MEVENLFTFPNKKLRAQAIKEYMSVAGYKKAVCFSCGNASRALREAGVEVLDISKDGDLQALRWFEQYEIKNIFKGYFDATSGHIPIECMRRVSATFKKYLGTIPETINLPTGSGETLVELKMAFPNTKITAIYNLNDATEYDEACVLNDIVKALAEDVVILKRGK